MVGLRSSQGTQVRSRLPRPVAPAAAVVAGRLGPKLASLRRDAARTPIPARCAAALCRFRPLRHARQFSLFRALRPAGRPQPAQRLVWPHEPDQIRSFSVKNYVLDTNVLLHDPNSILHFQEHNVLIPIEVIEEIDRFKRESTERGANARTVSRTLDSLRAQGRLSEGVNLPNGGRLRIIFQDKSQHNHLSIGDNNVDSRIVALAICEQKAHPKHATVLITKDINLRIKADALGLQAEDYESDRVLIKDLYTGMFELTVSAAEMAAFRADEEFEPNGRGPHFPNEYCTLTEESNPKRTALTKVDATGQKLVPITDAREGVWGIKPRN